MEDFRAGPDQIDMQAALPLALERRLALRLLGWWRALRGDRDFPSLADLDPAAIPDMWPQCFVLEVMPDPADPTFRAIGPGLAAEAGVPLVGRKLSEVPPGTLPAVAAAYARDAVAKRAPVSRGGAFFRPDGTTVLYRSILLPMSDDGATIGALLGAANGRAAAEQE